jgi:hypothetical protein
MSLGGDIERVMSMLYRAEIPYVTAEDLTWIETPEVRFFFADSGKRLLAVAPSNPYTSASDDAEKRFPPD